MTIYDVIAGIVEALRPFLGVLIGFALAFFAENWRQRRRRTQSAIMETWRALARATWAVEDHTESRKVWADHLDGREDDKDFWRLVNADLEKRERAVHEAFSELELQLHSLPNDLRTPQWGPLVEAVSTGNLPDTRKRLLTDDVHSDERRAMKAFKVELSEKARAALGVS